MNERVIVVIGGTTGIGLAACHALLAAGARVVALGLDPESVQAAADGLGPNARTVAKDARDVEAAAAAIDLAVSEFGRFDGLYHVAGGSGRSAGDGPLHEITPEGIDFTLNLNLKSVLLSNAAAVRRFRAQGGGGAVLNLSSVLANHPAPTHFATHAYTAAKAGIEGLTRAAAAYYADDGIRFNAIAPGLVDTPMAARAMSNPEVLDYVARRQRLGARAALPEDLAAAAVFFLSDASRFVTGQVLAVDGGWSAGAEPQRRIR